MATDVQASWVTTRPVVRATGGMVAAQHKGAADVGAAIDADAGHGLLRQTLPQQACRRFADRRFSWCGVRP